MADFNLSAEIALNLAKGAAESLKQQIQAGFKSPLIVDTDPADKAIKKAKKKAEKDGIVVPITFEHKQASKQYDEIAEKLSKHPIPLDVHFSPQSVKNNLSNKALAEIMNKRKITVPVDVIFGPKTQKEIDRLEKEIGNLLRYQEKLKKSVKETVHTVQAPPKSSPVDGNVLDLTISPKSRKGPKEAVDTVDDLIDSLRRLSSLSDKFGSSDAFGGGFFKESVSQIDKLILDLHKLENSAGLLWIRKGASGLDLLKEKFQGLSGDSAGNLIQSMQTLYKGFTELDTITKKLDALDLTSPVKSTKELRDQLTSAREAALKLFFGPDSADPRSFGVSMNAAFDLAKKSSSAWINSTSRDMRIYEGLLTQLAQKAASATAGGAGPERIGAITGLQTRITDLRSQGLNITQIKNDPEVIKLQAIAGALQFVDISASRASNSIEIMANKVTRLSNELKNSKGGQLVNLEAITNKARGEAAGKINAARAKASSGASASDINREIELAKSGAQQLVQDTIRRAEKINGLFDRINNQLIDFNTKGFDGAAQSLRNFLPELERLVQAGGRIDDLDKVVTQELSKSGVLKGLEAKVSTAIKQIERLRNVLDFSNVDDIAGAGKKLNDLQASLKAKTGQFAGLNPEKLDKEVAKGLFDVRAAQRFNESIATTANKLRAIGEANENLAVGKVYSVQADEFERAAARIAAGSDSLGVKFEKLKALSTSTFINAKFTSEGGFLGSVAKSAGLAAKRLGAFLILAQGLYKVQAIFSEAFQDALKIDREFIKLEQVLNKDFTGDVLTKNLKNLKTQIFDLGKTLGVSTLEVANSAQILAQAGFQGRDLQVLLSTVAKSQLGPSFGSATETAEAAIAVLKQFNLTAEQTQEAIGGINRLSAKYAVEAKGITEGVRRAGGVFATSGADVAEFAASFTLIKQQTREADESIATALRNVSQRLQSSRVQEYLQKALNVNLVENGQFVGFETSIKRIGEALKKAGANEKSPLFSEVREKIAGRLQAGRITPLLQDYEQYLELTEEFRKGSKSIEEDTVTAFNAIENKIQRAKSAIQQLFTEIIQSDLVKYAVEGFVQITTFATNLLRVLNSLPGAFIAIGIAAKALTGSVGKFAIQAAVSQVVPHVKVFKNSGGPIGFNTGGFNGYIPGRGPNKDSILAALTKGEYVINRDSVDQYGTGFLDRVNNGTLKANKGGLIPGFVKGGLFKSKNLHGGTPAFPLPSKFSGFGSVIAAFSSIAILLSGQAIPAIALLASSFLSAGVTMSIAIKKIKKFNEALDSGTIINPTRDDNTDSEFNIKNIRQKTQLALANQLANKPESLGPRRYRVEDTGPSGQRTYLDFEASDAETARRKALATGLYYNITGIKNVGGVKSQGAKENLENYIKTKEDNLKGTLSLNDEIAANKIAAKKIAEDFNNQRVAANKTTQPTNSNLSIPSNRFKGVNSVTKSLGGFGKSLISTKSGLVALGGTAILLQGALASFNSGISEFVLALTGATASFYALSQLGGTVTAITSGLGVDRKSRVASKTASTIAAIRGSSSTSSAAKAAQLAAGGGIKSDAAILAATTRLGQKDKLEGVTLTAGSGASVARGKIATTDLEAGGKLTQMIKGWNAMFPKIASLGTKLAGKLDLGAIAVGLISGALGFFVGKVEESSKKQIAEAKTLDQALSGGSKVRFAQIVKKPLEKLGGLISASLSGAAIGSAIAPGVGTIIGAVGGGLIYIASQMGNLFKKVPILKSIGGFFSQIGNFFSEIFNNVSDFLYSAVNGSQALEVSKLEDIRNFNLNQTSNSLAEQRRNKKGVRSLNYNQLSDILGTAQATSGIIDQVGQGKFSNLTADQQEKSKRELEQVASIFNQLGPQEQAKIVDAAKRMGFDFEETFRKVGVETNLIEQKAGLAFNALSLFFAGMQQEVELAASRLSGLEGGLNFFSSPENQQLAPNELFDIVKAGFDPNELGFGATFHKAGKTTQDLAQQFDPRLYKNSQFEASGARTSRLAQQSIIASPNLQIQPDLMDEFLKDVFHKASAGQPQADKLNEAFEVFVNSKGSEIEELAKDPSFLNGAKLNELFKEFGSTIDQGAIEQLKRLNDINKNFATQYQQLLGQRFALENEALGYLKDNVDKQKTLFELQNKAGGLTGDALARAQGGQASQLDNSRLNNILNGTGLGAGATPAQLTAGLLASRMRELNASGLATGNTPDEVFANTQLIIAEEKNRQEKYKAGLQYIANGTETATFAMQEFERASQKAAASSKFLSDALLGSDENMRQMVLGLQGMAVLEKAFAQGGVGAAQAELRRFSEDARQAVGGIVGGNEDKQNRFNELVGIGSNIAAGPEFAKAQTEVGLQQESNKGLAAGATDLANHLNKNIIDMKDFYANQFKNATAIINQAEATAKNLVGQIASLPQVIEHNGNINVNLIGAGALNALQDGLRDFVQGQIKIALDNHTQRLTDANQGLNRPAPLASSNVGTALSIGMSALGH